VTLPTGSGARDADAVAGLLRQHLNQHHPDTAHIVGRVQEVLAPELRPSRRPRKAPVMPGCSVGLVVAAAGVAAVIAVGTLALRPDIGEPAGFADPDPQTSAPTRSAPESAAETAVDETRDEEPTGSGSLSVSVTPATRKSSTSAPEISNVVLAAGVDGADPFVLVRRNPSDQVLTAGAAGNPVSAVEEGPFTTTWAGGQAPFPAGSETGWLVVRPTPGGPESGVVVQAAGAGAPAEIVLHVGLSGPGGLIETLIDGNADGGTRLSGGGDDFAVYTVTVGIAEAVDQVAVRVLTPEGGAVGFAAAVLTSS
jgi:hypothetical protein